MMTRLSNAQLTARVLDIARRVQGGMRVEDRAVELKAEWTPAVRAARLIAAQANAAASESILWIIGLKEGVGVVPVPNAPEPSQWFAQVQSAFDGPMPRPTDLHVPTDDGPLTAILFSTDEAPYVVHVAADEGVGGVRREVPWREGTSVRSARREELLRLLLPVVKAPEFEVRSATLFVHDRPGPEPNVMLHVGLYLLPVDAERLVYPHHRQGVALIIGQGEVELPTVEMERPVLAQKTPMIGVGDNEIVILGPTAVEICAQGYLPVARLSGFHQIQAIMTLRPGLQAHASVLPVELTYTPQEQYPHRYELQGRPWE